MTGEFTPTHHAPAEGAATWATPDPTVQAGPRLDGHLPVQVDEERGAWAHVICANGWTAWVDGRVLVPIQSPPPEPAVAIPLSSAPPLAGPPPRKKGRGCFATGCLTVLILLLIVVGVGALFYFRVPQQLGLLPSPERLLEGTPDRASAGKIVAELKAAGVPTRGLTIDVLPVSGVTGTLEYAVLDPSAGFAFPAAPANIENPLFRMMAVLASSPTVDSAHVEQIAVDYRDESGNRFGTFTAKTTSIRAYAAGRIAEEAFSAQVVGIVDPVTTFQSAILP